MIKFFRKIRQNMIKENKVSKYMLYAIGEIVLVVIGILIALQINNWNTAKKDEKSIKTIFINLKKDLLNDIIEAEILMDHYEKFNSIAQNIYNNRYTREDYLNPKQRDIYKGREFLPFVLNKQSFQLLMANQNKIPQRYYGMVKRLERLYVQNTETLDLKQNDLRELLKKYHEYVFDQFDWIFDYQKHVFSDAVIDYHLNNIWYKRQTLDYYLKSQEVLIVLAHLKSQAIVSYLTIHQSFIPEEILPPVIDKYKVLFTINNPNEFIGVYKRKDSDILFELVVKNNMLFFKEVRNNEEINYEGLLHTELGKDVLGTVFSDVIKIIRNNQGEVIGFDLYKNDIKIKEYKKLIL